MTTKQLAPPEATNDRAKDSILPELERLLRELAREREPQPGGEIESSIIARIDAYQRAVIKSVEALCANALVNARDIERLNCIIASLPEAKTENTDSRRILASIEKCSGDAGLSMREKGVLTQLVSGKSNREISEALGIIASSTSETGPSYSTSSSPDRAWRIILTPCKMHRAALVLEAEERLARPPNEWDHRTGTGIGRPPASIRLNLFAGNGFRFSADAAPAGRH
jgi:hypothetical protein